MLVVAFGVAIYFAFGDRAVIAALFLDVLSERVERLARGALPPQAPGIAAVLRRAGRSVIEEGKRVAFLLVLQAALLLVGLVPGLQPLAAAGGLAVAALFLPLVYTGFALDRRGVRFAARRRWVAGHPFDSLAFGGIGLALFLVPGLSFFCLLVDAGGMVVAQASRPLTQSYPQPAWVELARARLEPDLREARVRGQTAGQLRGAPDTEERHPREVELGVARELREEGVHVGAGLRFEIAAQALERLRRDLPAAARAA